MVYLHETACPCKYSREKRKECISYVHQRRSRKRTAETEKHDLEGQGLVLWEYYKFHLLGVILAIGVLSTIGTMIYRQTFTPACPWRLSTIAREAPAPALSWSRSAEIPGMRQKDLIEINEGLMVDFNEESTSQYGYATLAKISALAASESLDVVIGDQSAIDHYETISAYQNLGGIAFS